MEDKPLQPNVRCGFCNAVFYISPKYKEKVRCIKCGSVYASAKEIKI